MIKRMKNNNGQNKQAHHCCENSMNNQQEMQNGSQDVRSEEIKNQSGLTEDENTSLTANSDEKKSR